MTAKIRKIEMQIEALKQELGKARRASRPQKVRDYSFKTAKGQVKLSQLFGKSDDLLVVHNMGRSCNYCTMWADVLAGQITHIERRAPIVVVSPDTPTVQQKHAKARGWKFKMISDRGGKFTPDMGFKSKESGYWPGVSAFHKNEDGSIVRTGSTYFCPGDDYCPPWRYFDLLKDGAKGWEPI